VDEQTLHQVLHEITQQEIPDDMNSLWPALQAQLDMQQPRRARRVTRLGWASLVVVLSLVISAGAYAFFQGGKHGDPGIDWIDQNDLVTRLDQSITLDGVTVTLDWAYADAHRIALAYSAARADVGDNQGFTPEGGGHASCLLDDQGNEFLSPQMIGGVDDPSFFKADEYFDASIIQGTPGTLTLRYQLWMAIAPIPPTPSPDEASAGGGFGGGGGGGGGGSDSGPIHCGDPAWLVTWISGPAVGPFVFDFTVPFYPAVTVEPAQTLTVNGVGVTLDEIAYAPSMTNARLCYDLPDESKSWAPFGGLETSQGPIDWSSVTSGEPPADGRQCALIQFPAPYDRQPATWTLTIDRIEAGLDVNPDNFEQMQALFAEYGITIEMHQSDGGFGWGAHLAEDSEYDYGTALDGIMTRLGLRVKGPWVFTLDVPGAE